MSGALAGRLLALAINASNAAPWAYVELARAAEPCGYEAVRAPEIRATDPFGLLGTDPGLACPGPCPHAF